MMLGSVLGMMWMLLLVGNVALLVPFIKKLAYFVFLDTSAPKGTHSWSMILVGFFIYFIAIFIDSTTAANINDKGE
jgi:hypothetical protein